METIRLGINDASRRRGIDAFWHRTWMAGETGLAPHCFGKSTELDQFLKRIENLLSRYVVYREFFSDFSPLDDEYCIPTIEDEMLDVSLQTQTGARGAPTMRSLHKDGDDRSENRELL